MKVYKVQHKVSGLFSSGGSCPRWSTKGKVWTSMGHVKVHLAQAHEPQRGHKQAPYTQAEVVEYDLMPEGSTDVAVLLQDIEAVRAEKVQKVRDLVRQRVEEQEREQLRKLQEKYKTAL